MQSLAPGSILPKDKSPAYFLGATSAATQNYYQTQMEKDTQPRHNGALKVHLVGGYMRTDWLKSDLNHFEAELKAIKLSIKSPTIDRPEWVKSGKDMVRWIKMKKEGRLNVNEG